MINNLNLHGIKTYPGRLFILSVICAGLMSACQAGSGKTRDKHPNILFAISDDQSFPYTSAKFPK